MVKIHDIVKFMSEKRPIRYIVFDLNREIISFASLDKAKSTAKYRD